MHHMAEWPAARYAYLALAAEATDELCRRLTEALQLYNSELSPDAYFLRVFYGQYTQRQCSRQMQLLGGFLPGTLGREERATLEGFLERPRRACPTEIRRILAAADLVEILGSVPVRPDFRRFFISNSAANDLPVYLSLNLVCQARAVNDSSVLLHFLESEISDMYLHQMLSSLVTISGEADVGGSSPDPVGLLEDYLLAQTRRVPEIQVIVWRYSHEYDAIIQQVSTVGDFSYEFFSAEAEESNPIWQAFSKGEVTFLPNVRQSMSSRCWSAEFRSQCDTFHLRSVRFEPLWINGEIIGVVGFFSVNNGNNLELFPIYRSYLTQQIRRRFSESRQLEQLIASNEKLKQLMPLMAIGKEVTERMHDIRDDLNKLSNFFYIVENKDRHPDRGKVAQVGARGSKVVNDIKSRLGKQLQTFKAARERLQRVNLCEFVAEQYERHRVDSGFAKVNINLKAYGAPLHVKIQRFYLARALDNLIANGVYFSKMRVSDHDPFVRLEVVKDGNSAIIRILDSGPGIQQHPVERIFEAGETTKPDGFGVGLSIVRTIIEEHGGAILASNSAQFGALFEVRLPLSQ